MTPTIRHIAQACGLSTATVSRALNGHPRVLPETRRRVWKAAKHLGWKPNPLAAAFMAHRRAASPHPRGITLAFMVDHPLSTMPLHTRDTFEAARDRAAIFGYRMTPFSWVDDGMTPERMDALLFNRNIPGLIISGLRTPNTRLPDFNWSRYAAVAMGPTLAEPRLHRVMTNHFYGFRTAVERIYALGYRRLGIVVSHGYDERVDHGLLFAASYAKLHLPSCEGIEILVLDTQEPREIARIQAWVRAVQPDIVLGVTPAREAIETLGLRIPNDIAFAYPDRHPAFPHNAGNDQRHDLAGALATDVLVSLLTSNQRGIPGHYVEHLVEGSWADGVTAPPVRAATLTR